MENTSKKNKLLELEEEIKKLSGQQNLQQRIHHHAKIKVRFSLAQGSSRFGLFVSCLIFSALDIIANQSKYSISFVSSNLLT